MKHWIVGLLLSLLVVGYANASLPISSPINRPLSSEQISKYKDRSWEPGVGYARISEERRRKYDFDRALQYGQYADAWQLIKGKDVLFPEDPWACLSETLRNEMVWSGGTGEDYIPLIDTPGPGGRRLLKPSKKGDTGGKEGGFTTFDEIYFQKSKVGIVWSSRDYSSVFALVKEAAEQLVKRKDLHLKELYALKVFLDDRGIMYDEQQPPEKTTSCDLWHHKYVLQNKKPPTTEAQRKAIRLWMMQTLNEGAEKVLSNPNRFRESGFLNIGSMFPGINWPSKYRSDWFLWYGEVPPELQRFEELSIKITQLDEQLTKLEMEKMTAQKAAKKAAEDVKAAEKKRLEADKSLRK
ncbi:MAG: hypothetical protein NTX87_11420 [Planctomycetota bacterium]|nr:hypothetical protein [Planctomycetota bacterium]